MQKMKSDKKIDQLVLGSQTTALTGTLFSEMGPPEGSEQRWGRVSPALPSNRITLAAVLRTYCKRTKRKQRHQ